ncbi:uroporphyrinogen-III C-methyltransferase [Dasania sp. GY-MA-18]|uniref:Uroporphyrinogen-III C-methyltransferase n=1 Tax=Dasania phycosphaerae TaxID=2950436 RepID=A0A9J6RL50_9GAMM|nr:MULTISPECIES: uroporphyrinogen-III C-methyltransferase [Dasania]MCR8922483.1 uroporphyrinogen-III C-methyltransferase [Dasania sp. GY-MA-18]MCZ0864911.1 uroporphyrinogen-III C-methyltransferase [Dasania phycosphaerae]MCZ0868639.1 uroporphyrinogen-III C-methyltransferase [Dasania phycosphaerae]
MSDKETEQPTPKEQDDTAKDNQDLVKQKASAMKGSGSADSSSTAKNAAAKNSSANTDSHTHSVAPTAANKAGASKAIALVAVLLALAAALASGYVWQQSQLSQQQQSELVDELSQLQQQLQQQTQLQQQKEATLREQLDAQLRVSQQQQLQLQEQLNSLDLTVKGQQQRLQSMSSTDREDWLLAEAEYLMKLANQRLLMGKELEGAAELLAAADDILRDFDDAALHAVRKILAQEITALKSAARFDLEGLYLRIGALAQQVEQIDLFKAPQLNINTQEQKSGEQKTWQQRMNSAIEQAKHKLSQYIQINRREQVYKPILAPEQEAAIRHNLRLMFEQAQLALLAGKQKLYDQSLIKSQQWLNDYFAINPDQVAAVNQILENLKQQAVTVELPDISASSRALKTYIETRHELPKKKSAPQSQQQSGESVEGNAA